MTSDPGATEDRPRKSGWSRSGWSFLLLAGISVGLGLIYLVDPEGNSLFPSCPFRALTGIRCPGCGSLRATHHLLHGRPLRVMELNPLYLVGWATVGLFLVRPGLARRPTTSWIVAGVIGVFWLVRIVQDVIAMTS